MEQENKKENLEQMIKVEVSLDMELVPLKELDYRGKIALPDYGILLDYAIGLMANHDKIMKRFKENKNSFWDQFKVELRGKQNNYQETDESTKRTLIRLSGDYMWRLGYAPELFDHNGERKGFTSQKHLALIAGTIGCSISQGYAGRTELDYEKMDKIDPEFRTDLEKFIEKYKGNTTKDKANIGLPKW